MNSFALFTDVSLHPQRKLGVGACLLVPAALLNTEPDAISRAEVTTLIKFRRFAETSSTRLELQTVLWAVEIYWAEFNRSDSVKVLIHTDSQCVAGLLARRAMLEAKGFIATCSGRPLTNTPLYRAFYILQDKLGFEVIKVAGHSRAASHSSAERIFSYIDQEARRALNLWMDEIGQEG